MILAFSYILFISDRTISANNCLIYFTLNNCSFFVSVVSLHTEMFIIPLSYLLILIGAMEQISLVLQFIEFRFFNIGYVYPNFARKYHQLILMNLCFILLIPQTYVQTHVRQVNCEGFMGVPSSTQVVYQVKLGFTSDRREFQL